KAAARLPERRAFWELVRIAFTEQPKSFMDNLRFQQLKILFTCGLRIGEVALLPVDWRRTREYFGSKSDDAGTRYGFSSAAMIRHFAEKQHVPDGDGNVLTEAAQYIPKMF